GREESNPLAAISAGGACAGRMRDWVDRTHGAAEREGDEDCKVTAERRRPLSAGHGAGRGWNHPSPYAQRRMERSSRAPSRLISLASGRKNTSWSSTSRPLKPSEWR